ncbi:MAG: ankyrin repeat domain-containing protein [Pseudomonadota bacterium]
MTVPRRNARCLSLVRATLSVAAVLLMPIVAGAGEGPPLDLEAVNGEANEATLSPVPTRRELNEALLAAVLAGDVGKVRTGLEAGASANARDGAGRSALMLAVTQGHEVTERVLQEGFGTRLELIGLPAPAVTSEQSAMIEMLVAAGADVDAPDREGRTALQYAAERDYAALVRQLANAGARADTPFPSGLPAACLVASRGFAQTLAALRQAGADLTATSPKTGKRPVHYAAEGDHVAAVAYLLEAGADVESTTSRGWTPLLIAAAGGQLALTQLLLDHGADRNAVTGRGLSPLDVARARGHTAVVALLESSVSP